MNTARTSSYYRVKLICKDVLPGGCPHWSEALLEERYSDYADVMLQCVEMLQWERRDVQFAYPVLCQETSLESLVEAECKQCDGPTPDEMLEYCPACREAASGLR
jgi:Zn finger protein HypA/HybF involved in hydrogenase expression